MDIDIMGPSLQAMKEVNGSMNCAV